MKSLHATEYKKFLDYMVAARKESGFTQQQLAERLGKPQSFVSKYESGERRLDILEFLDVCKVLSVSPVSIIERLECAR